MHRFGSILFSPLGESDNAAAVRRVAAIAHENDALLTLFGVLAEPSGLQRVLHRQDFFSDVQQADRRATEKRLERWAAKNDDGQIRTEIEMGSQALRIIDRVIREGHDLVVVTTDDDRHDKATIKRLLRKCPCPVWVIRPSRARVQRVLAAVNPDPAEYELNRVILELAASMVERFGGELHLIHAWELYGESTMRSSAFMHTPPAEVEALLEREEASHADALCDLLAESGLGDAPWQVHLVKGPAEDVVVRQIAKSRINLLVMGTIARTLIPGVLIGSTAEKVLDEVRCSVVAVKPPGFVSPLSAQTR